MAKDLMSGEVSANNDQFLPLIIGFIVALITGVVACKWMITLVKNSKLKYFSYYCFTIGVIIIATKLFEKTNFYLT